MNRAGRARSRATAIRRLHSAAKPQPLRNSDLRAELYKPAKHPLLRRRHAAAITRKLTLLRAHGLLRKTPHSHRYQLTPKGRRIYHRPFSRYRFSLRPFQGRW
jgi:DNA-binding HxlR family transcriptional regulator